jgi:hypothetical protein
MYGGFAGHDEIIEKEAEKGDEKIALVPCIMALITPSSAAHSTAYAPQLRL